MVAHSPEMPALLSDDTARFVTTRSATGSGRRREAASGNTLARMTVHLLVHPHAIDLWQSIQCAAVSIDRAIWSMKCSFKFSHATRISFCTMRPKGNGAALGSEWIAEARFETSGDALLRLDRDALSHRACENPGDADQGRPLLCLGQQKPRRNAGVASGRLERRGAHSDFEGEIMFIVRMRGICEQAEQLALKARTIRREQQDDVGFRGRRGCWRRRSLAPVRTLGSTSVLLRTASDLFLIFLIAAG
jgi:hypothetical protein